MHSYYIIPLKRKAPWFTKERIFYCQLGKSRKHELLVEQHYQQIIQKCIEYGLTFVFHKHLVKNVHQLKDNDGLFLNDITFLSEEQYYDELAYQAFDHQTIDSVHIVRKYNEKFLIAWGDYAFKGDNNKTLRFPFESLKPLEAIIVGDNCEFNPYLHYQPSNISPLKTPSTHLDCFSSAYYRCNCSYESEIFIEKDYNFYNIMDVEGYCACCNQEKENICDGNLIFRKDWPDPDDDPWQMQCAYIPEGTGFCSGCEANYKSDYRNLIVSCAICDGDMVYIDLNK